MAFQKFRWSSEYLSHGSELSRRCHVLGRGGDPPRGGLEAPNPEEGGRI